MKTGPGKVKATGVILFTLPTERQLVCTNMANICPIRIMVWKGYFTCVFHLWWNCASSSVEAMCFQEDWLFAREHEGRKLRLLPKIECSPWENVGWFECISLFILAVNLVPGQETECSHFPSLSCDAMNALIFIIAFLYDLYFRRTV